MFEIHWRRNFEWILHRMHHHLYGWSIPGWNATCRGTRFSTMEGCSSSCYKAFDVPRQHHWMDWRSVWKSGLRKWIWKIHVYLIVYIYIMIYFFFIFVFKYIAINFQTCYTETVRRYQVFEHSETTDHLSRALRAGNTSQKFAEQNRRFPQTILYLCSKGRYGLRY